MSPRSFLAGLLDALGAGVERTLAALGLVLQLLESLLVGLLLGLEGLVVVVLVDLLLLGLLVVDRLSAVSHSGRHVGGGDFQECRPLSRQQRVRCAAWAAAPRYSPRPNVATRRCCGDQSGPTPSPSSSPSPTAAHTCTAPRRHRLSIAVQRTFETIQSGILAVKS